MRLLAFDPATKRAILVALTRVPEPVRSIALREVSFISVGVRTAGMALAPPLPEGWVVILAERGDAAVNTVGHELAHVMLQHAEGSAEAEREACDLAKSWGFEGNSADAEVAARLFRESRPAAPTMRALTRDSVVRVECQCGATCRVLAPTVPGMVAEVGVECDVCGWVAIMQVRELVGCASCPERADVTWAEGASPERPVATWACDCGATSTLRLHTDPYAEADTPPRDAEPEETWPIRRAARRLLGIEESLRRMEPLVLVGEVPDGLEACRSTLVWVRGLLSRAVRNLDPSDPRRLLLNDADGELASAGTELVQHNLAAAADLVATVGRALDAMLTPTEGCRA